MSTLPIDLPSLLPRRKSRVTESIHHWCALDGTIDARSGQVAAFSRAGVGVAIDANGVLRSCPEGLYRWEMVDLDGDGIRETAGLLLEGARTQALANPAAPATQTQSLTAGTYTCWMNGTGTVTLSGGASGVASEGTPVTFTLGSTQNVTFTVAGSVTRFQCENSKAPTSFIAGASRAADVLLYPHLAFPREFTRYTRIVDRGIRAAAGDNLGVWSLGALASGAMSLALFGSTNGFTLRHVGGTTQSAEVATAATYNLVVEFRSVVHANGSLTLGVSISGAAEVTASAATANALAAAYSAEENRIARWSTDKDGNMVLLDDRMVPGIVSLAELRRPL